MASRTAARGHPVDEQQLSTSLNSLSVNGSSSGSHSGGASQLSNSLQEVVTGLMQDADTQAAAVAELAAIVDQAEGVTAAAVGKAIRDFGAFERLLELLERPETVTEALRVIGNLASNAVDPSADETKRLLHEMGAFPRILPLIHSPQAATVVYALGAVQNLTVRREYAVHMVETGADHRLRALKEHSPDETLRHFAKGCLANMDAVLAPEYVPAGEQRPSAAASRSPPSAGGLSRLSRARNKGGAAAALQRVSVPADNNCLFASLAFLCDPSFPAADPSDDPQRLLSLARSLRADCAALIERDHSPETLALLGFEDAQAYGAWIRDETHWGGEPEVSMLAELYRIEIGVATCDGTRMLHYGGQKGRKVAFLLYTGQHYDPLVGPSPGGQPVRLFPPPAGKSADQKQNAAREAAALHIAREHTEANARLAAERSLPAGSLPSSPADAASAGQVWT